ncbi:hypothetical protein Sedge_0056, partial [Mycobacterium phage Sedge]
MLPQLSSGEHV